MTATKTKTRHSVAQQYNIVAPTMMLQHKETPQQYVLRVQDRDESEKPREKMINNSPGALTAQELLAVVLGVGTRKEEVMLMASRIMREYGDRGIAAQKNPKTLSEDLDIPIGKACQIVAAFELGQRFFQKTAGGFVTLRTAKDVHAHVQDLISSPKEQLRGLYLNSRYQLIHDEVISIGTLTENLVHPREVFRPALEFSAVAVILVHNHPSGSLEPTASDLETTQQVIAAGALIGIDVLDHVIVSSMGYMSVIEHLRENKQL